MTATLVEVSGWDVEEKFFVEKTEDEQIEGAHAVRLRHPVARGALLFLRTLDPPDALPSIPGVFEVRSFQATGMRGEIRVELVNFRRHSQQRFRQSREDLKTLRN